MILRELKEIVNAIPEEQLDLQVRVIADHGQVAITASTASVDYIYEDTYMADTVHEDDVTEESVMIFLIGD